MSGQVVELRGVEVFAYHGVHAHERRDGQTFLIDARLVCCSDAAGSSDRLADAVDYGAVADRLVEIASGGPYALLERLAALIADDLIASFPVSEARVTVHKPQAPIPHPFADVAVTVTRRR